RRPFRGAIAGDLEPAPRHSRGSGTDIDAHGLLFDSPRSRGLVRRLVPSPRPNGGAGGDRNPGPCQYHGGGGEASFGAISYPGDGLKETSTSPTIRGSLPVTSMT